VISPRVGVLGGTFDPIHQGHLDLARAAREALALESIWLVPSHVPPHRAAPHASVFHRFAMVSLAASEETWLIACDMELHDPGPSYTSRTLQRLTAAGYDARQIFFLTGADAFAEIATWRDYPALLDRAHFVVVSRPGLAVGALRKRLPDLASRMVDLTHGAAPPSDLSILLLDAVTADVSSTEVRRRLSAGEPLDGRVPVAVERHALRHSLYRIAAAHATAASHLHEDN
jgi:nicotinate-nucleotide adenylyltransferase